ncbi:MAG: SPOR domain-containing protein [Gemmatimonas sp.]
MSDWERPSLSSSGVSGRGGPKKKKPHRLRWVLGAAVLVVAVGFGWISWSAYRTGQSFEDAAMVPLLKADSTPTRIRPDDPGGMTVPNQDKQIYDRIDPRRAPPQGVERLLPAPEQPVGRPPPAIPALKADDPSVPREVTTPTVHAAPEPPKPVAPPPSEAIPSPFQKVARPPAPPTGLAARAPVEKPVPAPVAEKPAPAPQQQAAAPRPAAPASGVRIQLAAVGSEDAAHKEWDRLKRASGGLLDSVNPAFVRADLGDRGVVYRIQAGPLASAEAAADLCSKLKARNVGCFVAR